MLRLGVLWVIGALAFWGLSSEATASPAAANQVSTISSSGPLRHFLVPDEGRITTKASPNPVTSEPGSERPARNEDTDGEPTTTPEPERPTPAVGDDQESTTTSKPERPQRDEGVDQEPTTPSSESGPTTTLRGDDQELATTSTVVAPVGPGRPSSSPRVKDSNIPLSSIALSLFVLAGVGAVSYRLVRRQPGSAESDEMPSPTTAPETGQPTRPADGIENHPGRDRTSIDPSTADFLIGLGEALTDAGAAVSHVETALQSVARANGAEGVGVIVLPTALIVSVPNDDDLVTEIGAPGRAQLRFDQIEDVLRLVHDAEAGTIRASEGNRRLATIRSAAAQYSSRVALLGISCLAAGVAAILHGTWVEVVLAALLGAAVGVFRLWTGRLDSSYRPFVVLVAAGAVSAIVFTLTRVIGDLLTFPVLVSPLISFLPGGLLTIAVLELATGQIVSGVSRLASGALQLVLMAIGLVAGAQLVGVPVPDLTSSTQGPAAMLAPWIGVAVYGIGVVWFYGARSSALKWMLLVMYVAYAGQVIGGLFFGSSLSAFVGALAMTPIAVLAARRSTAPSPLVTILPAFWLLVPGALGLTGVTGLFGASGVATTGVLVTTVTSMVGVSLGILLGLLLVAHDPERPFSETLVADEAEPTG